MYTCKVCQKEFINRKSFMSHCNLAHKEKEKEVATVETMHELKPAIEAAIITPEVSFGAPNRLVIPLNFLPPEVKYYSAGKTIGLRILGKYDPITGVTVDNVELIR